MAESARDKGYAAFSSGNFIEAIKFFSEVIDIDPTNHFVYSGRSACYASLNKYSEALEDAKRTVELNPYWAEGYCRLGAAFQGLSEFGEAVVSYKNGLNFDSSNQALRSGFAAAESKVQAQKEKILGNAAYRKKEFTTAIDHYNKAIVLDSGDVSFITNRAAVYLEMGKYEDCIKDCNKAVGRGRELQADSKIIARALTRKGWASVKMAKTSKDYIAAIEAFQAALAEHRNPDTLEKLNAAVKASRDLVQQENFDPKLAEEARLEGNELFKQQKYPEAIKRYTESLRRNPKDPRVYSNRAACYTKLGAMPEGLKDAEKCIVLNPTFVKGYIRKGAIQYFMKKYDDALQTYMEGLKHNSQNLVLLDGVSRCVYKINRQPGPLKLVLPDRLSPLADHIIHNIYSSLETRCLVQTSILSTDWGKRLLWKSTPVLKFYPKAHSNSSRLVSLVDKIFDHRVAGESIEEFDLFCEKSMELEWQHVSRWLSNLEGQYLKVLHLRGVVVTDLESDYEEVKKKRVLTLSYHGLEDLVICTSVLYSLGALSINAPVLKSLSVLRTTFCTMNFNCPQLTSLTYCDIPNSEITFGSMARLSTANLDVLGAPKKWSKNAAKILQGVSCARTLSICDGILEDLLVNSPQAYPNLRDLIVAETNWRISIRSIGRMLLRFPFLKTFAWKRSENVYSKWGSSREDWCDDLPEDEIRLSLEKVEIHNYYGKTDENKLIDFIRVRSDARILTHPLA